jgi:putative intracellular protease/amidase
MPRKVLFVASNYGLWAEELSAPWDAVKAAGHEVTLATKTGRPPLPMTISVDPELDDPIQHYQVNPQEVVDRFHELMRSGEWANPIKTEDARIEEYDALVLIGGPGSPLDVNNNPHVHQMALSAYQDGKTIGAICYAVGALAFTRDPDNKDRSIIWGRRVTAHPHAWDFDTDLTYELEGATPDNPGTDAVSTGFMYPLQYVVEGAAGPDGEVLTDPTTNREKPLTAVDSPFVTALSVESSIAFGQRLVEALAD